MGQKVNVRVYTILILMCLFSGCELLLRENYCSPYVAGELILNDTLELRYGELYCNSKFEIRLAVDSIQDSRCPKGMYCIWEGNGRVKINLLHDGLIASFWLNTHANFLQDTLIHGLRYELIDLLPYPEVGQDYQLGDVRVLMRISD